MHIFTFNNFAKIVIKRFLKKQSDTCVLIYGRPRTGKTTLGFRLLIPYLHYMRKLAREGTVKWNPPQQWRLIFKRYFAMSAGDMIKMVKKNEEGSIVFVDEGLDLLSWHHQMEKEQQDLIELLMKTGKKGIFTIIITPSLSLFTKSMLSRFHYMFIIWDEPSEKGNYAHLLRNYKSPVLAEKNPFGLKKVIDVMLKYPDRFEDDVDRVFSMFYNRYNYIGMVKFKPIKKELYDLYEHCVKEPLIMQMRKKKGYVTMEDYERLKYAFETILWNLWKRDGKTFTQISSLLTDKFGKCLLSAASVSKYIRRMEAREVGMKFTLDEGEKEEKEEDTRDLKLGEELEGALDGEEKIEDESE